MSTPLVIAIIVAIALVGLVVFLHYHRPGPTTTTVPRHTVPEVLNRQPDVPLTAAEAQRRGELGYDGPPRRPGDRVP